MKSKMWLIFISLLAFGLILGCTSTSTGPQNQSTDRTMNVGVYPPDGSVNVSVNEILLLSFEVPVIETEVPSRIAIERVDDGSNTPVVGSYSWNSNKTELTFVPSNSFAGNGTYRVQMRGMMPGRDGRNYSPITVPGRMRCDSTSMPGMHGGGTSSEMMSCDSCMRRGGMMGGTMPCDSSTMRHGGMMGGMQFDSSMMGSGNMPCDSSMMGGGGMGGGHGSHHGGGMGGGGMTGRGMGNQGTTDSYFATGMTIIK